MPAGLDDSSLSAGAIFNLGKAVVMIVDDNAFSMNLTSQTLIGFGAKSRHQCSSAAEAMETLKNATVDLLIVDYLQLLAGSSKSSQANRVQEITEITTGLKALAKELVVPIIALSQLSRQVEQREDKRPQLSDLRESGSIEQDADVVMFVFREEYYVERLKPAEGDPKFPEWFAKMSQVSGKAEVIIGKQRHGPVGTVQLAFEAQFTRFGNLAREYHMPDRDGE